VFSSMLLLNSEKQFRRNTVRDRHLKLIRVPVFQLDQNRGTLRPAPEILRPSALLSHPLRSSDLSTLPLCPSALSILPLRPSALFMPYMKPKRVRLCCPLVTLSQNLSN
jgi:hypothetical protein